MKHKIEKTVRKLLERAGYRVSRVPRPGAVPDPLMRSGEWQQLVADLERFYASKPAGFSWATPSDVLTYLTPKRIRQYHAVTGVCREQGLKIDGLRIADAGTGVGYFLRHLSETSSPMELWGFDMKTDDLALASHLCPNARLERSTFEAMPPAYFDGLFLMQVLEHVADPGSVILTLMRALRPGGFLLMTIPDGRTDNLRAGDYYPEMASYWGHINFWSIESWDLFFKREFPDYQVRTGVVPVETNNLYGIIFRK